MADTVSDEEAARIGISKSVCTRGDPGFIAGDDCDAAISDGAFRGDMAPDSTASSSSCGDLSAVITYRSIRARLSRSTVSSCVKRLIAPMAVAICISNDSFICLRRASNMSVLSFSNC
jgi:hypothetical protein